MNKPYIICYMMTSVDGRIDCDMVGRLAGVEDYYPLLDELGLQSAVSGKITARLELAEPGEFMPESPATANREIVLIGAGIDGRASYPPVFNRNDNGKKEPTPLELVDVKKYSSGAVFIRYKMK